MAQYKSESRKRRKNKSQTTKHDERKNQVIAVSHAMLNKQNQEAALHLLKGPLEGIWHTLPVRGAALFV